MTESYRETFQRTFPLQLLKRKPLVDKRNRNFIVQQDMKVTFEAEALTAVDDAFLTTEITKYTKKNSLINFH